MTPEAAKHQDSTAVLLEIAEKLGRLEGKLDSVRGDNLKVTLALIGVITATIGTKYIGTPVVVEILAWIVLVMLPVVIGFTIAARKRVGPWLMTFRLAFCVMVGYSVVLRLFVLDMAHPPADGWYATGGNLGWLLLCVLLLIVVWQDLDRPRCSKTVPKEADHAAGREAAVGPAETAARRELHAGQSAPQAPATGSEGG